MEQPKEPNTQQPAKDTWDIRKVTWTNDKADELWKRMMQGGKNLTERVKLPFPEKTPPKG